MRLVPALTRIGAVAAVAAASLAFTAPPASAAPAAGGGTGWVRVAHLSPDTKAVDVRLAPLSGSGAVKRLENVPYGAVSKYWALPTGEYAVAMRPAGAADSAPPVVSASVTVKRGDAATVAVFGRNADLRTKIVSDDLAPAGRGQARVRLVQASTAAGDVTVRGQDGTVVARDAAPASVTSYAAVKAGIWRLTATRSSTRSSEVVPVRQGQIVSLFVLDRADGGLDLHPVVDSSGVGATPNGYLATGGGFLAHQQEADDRGRLAGGVAVGLIAFATAGAVLLRRRRVVRA